MKILLILGLFLAFTVMVFVLVVDVILFPVKIILKKIRQSRSIDALEIMKALIAMEAHHISQEAPLLDVSQTDVA